VVTQAPEESLVRTSSMRVRIEIVYASSFIPTRRAKRHFF